MQMFPGRFPNEILHDLDIALTNRVLAAQRVVDIEDKRLAFLRPNGPDPGDDWIRIREHDVLVEDYTVQVVDERREQQ